MNCHNTFCYRHNPALNSSRNHNDFYLQEELSTLPVDEQAEIMNIWNTFQHASPSSRLLILKGILASACTPQLSYLSNAVTPLLSTDFTHIFPREITIQIFRYLDASSLCTAAQVSRHWRQLADDDTLWHRLCEQHINKKCTRCGWGLPLLPLTRKRKRDETTCVSKKRAWKEVYSERLIVERHWRRNMSKHYTLKRHHSASITCLQLSEANNTLITGSQDKTVTVWNLETGQVLRQLKGHSRPIRTLQFDDTKLVTGSSDHTLRIWNYNTGQCIRTLEGHTDGVNHLHFNCRLLASGSADATIKVWNFQTGECFTLTGHTQAVNHVQIHQQHFLVSASDDCTLRLWDLNKRVCIRTFHGHVGPIMTAIPGMPGHSFSKENDAVIISGSKDHTIKVWSIQTGQCLQTLFGHVQGIGALAFDKLRLVSGSDDGSLKLWDSQNGLPMYSLKTSGACPVTAVGLSDTKVVSADDQGDIHVWDYGLS
ncbi:hypothetical protein RMATCC62417_03771 [Rhizopus microsporus]|nr:hypothetical protein RMATCC62417_03771 [Rhizopus microsporus]CEJ04427.1 hypothetical protein RMCBS344292_18389 [Rhizopus microsporus]